MEKGPCDVESGSEVPGASDGGEFEAVGWPPSASGGPAGQPAEAPLGVPRCPYGRIKEGTSSSDEGAVIRPVSGGERAYAFLRTMDGVAVGLRDVLWEVSPCANGLPRVRSWSVEVGRAPVRASYGTKCGNGIDGGFGASGGALDVE